MTASAKFTLAMLWLLLLVSSVAVVWSKQQARNQFVALQRLQKERDQLDTEWGQLRLEQSTWMTYGRIEKISHDELHMSVPDLSNPDKVHLIEPATK
ncbi:MAG TPA: cell division protein FtsL [Steroidobacteraceae bacterium]|nr:cell division protein FtsL [Steroidobacteraceae bacterium]